MHVTIEDQEKGHRCILCIERGATHGEVLTCSPELLRKAETIAKALGVNILRMTIGEAVEVPKGWEVSSLRVIGKVLNGK